MATFTYTVDLADGANPPAAADQSRLLLGKDIHFRGDYKVNPAGDYVLVEGVEALRQAIYRRLITRPGEFRARPEYGVGLNDFVKRRRNSSTLSELKQRVVDQLSLESRIQEINDVSVTSIDDGIQIVVVVTANGQALKFEPFDFKARDLIGQIAAPEAAGLRIGV